MPIIKIKSKTCPICKQSKEFEVEESDFEKYKAGYFIQEAFPTMSSEDRERFITGFCPECWNNLFPDEEEK